MTEVLNETDYEIDIAEFVQLADFVLSAMHVSTEVELVVGFVKNFSHDLMSIVSGTGVK